MSSENVKTKFERCMKICNKVTNFQKCKIIPGNYLEYASNIWDSLISHNNDDIKKISSISETVNFYVFPECPHFA
jgi:hypothetical protein